MKRRKFITLVGSAVVWPLAARAQQAGHIYRIGSLQQAPRDAPHHVAFFAKLKEVGFIEGQNLLSDRRGFGLRVDSFHEVASEHVKAQVDLISCGGEGAARAAQEATRTIPIIAVADDMVRAGLVRSLGKPDGNITGVSILATELDGKRQEILLEAIPDARNIAALTDSNSATVAQLDAIRGAAGTRGVELSVFQVSTIDEIGPAIDAAKRSGAQTLNVLSSSLLFNNRQIILERVATYRLPAIYQSPGIAEQGGLLGYGPRIVQVYRDIFARQAADILRGSKPGEIPVEQPTRFELVVNLKAAKALGLKVSESFLQRADEVIE
jgi:putative ABC transport system substrate-binding protein